MANDLDGSIPEMTSNGEKRYSRAEASEIVFADNTEFIYKDVWRLADKFNSIEINHFHKKVQYL